MDRFLLNGCYQTDTLASLKDLGVRNFGFDLRARSLSLVPVHQLKLMLLAHPGIRPQLIFEGDRASTVSSVLDLFRLFSPTLQFRDHQSAEYYDQFDTPFHWFFHPAHWKGILMCRNIRSVILPLALRDFYQEDREFWALIDRRGIDVILHADTFAESEQIRDSQVQLSIDLTREVESSYRVVDHKLLRSHLLEKL